MRWLVLILFSCSAVAQELNHHFDLDLTSRELVRILESRQAFQSDSGAQILTTSEDLEKVIAVGKRNLAWLDLINSKRKEPLKFTKPGTLGAVPITDPRKYSDVTVIKEFAELAPLLLPEMKAVLLDGANMSDEPPADLANYLILGRKVDRLYQTALRWILLSPYLGWLEKARQRDVRGIYFLEREVGLAEELGVWPTLSSEKQIQLKEWLIMICYNAIQNDRACAQAFDQSVRVNKVNEFYLQYKERAQNTYASFFSLQNARTDTSWERNLLKIPIQSISSNLRADFVKVNIEEEFQWQDWHLQLDFTNAANVRVIFEPGVNPHVNALGGNLLYMDANAPLTEWDNQWTIRHEFGHVLGLPDCYVEFYQPSEKLIITYQIDAGDLMCSRAGKMNERIFAALRAAYQK